MPSTRLKAAAMPRGRKGKRGLRSKAIKTRRYIRHVGIGYGRHSRLLSPWLGSTPPGNTLGPPARPCHGRDLSQKPWGSTAQRGTQTLFGQLGFGHARAHNRLKRSTTCHGLRAFFCPHSRKVKKKNNVNPRRRKQPRSSTPCPPDLLLPFNPFSPLRDFPPFPS